MSDVQLRAVVCVKKVLSVCFNGRNRRVALSRRSAQDPRQRDRTSPSALHISNKMPLGLTNDLIQRILRKENRRLPISRTSRVQNRYEEGS